MSVLAAAGWCAAGCSKCCSRNSATPGPAPVILCLTLHHQTVTETHLVLPLTHLYPFKYCQVSSTHIFRSVSHFRSIRPPMQEYSIKVLILHFFKMKEHSPACHSTGRFLHSVLMLCYIRLYRYMSDALFFLQCNKLLS